jgi:hypothetical protein
MASIDRIAVAGMHLNFSSFGHVVAQGSGYAFVPATFQFAN